MFQDYPHSTQDYYYNCSGSSFLVFVLSMAIISNQKPSKGVVEAFKSYTDVSSSEKIISSLWMTTKPFTNPTIQTFLSSWVQLQWQVPYIMRVELVHILSKYLILPCFNKMVLDQDVLSTQNVYKTDIQEILEFLRLALKSFDLLSLSTIHSSYAHQVLINIALDTATRVWMDDTFQRLLRLLLVKDSTDTTHICKCSEKWLYPNMDRWKGQYGYLKHRILGYASPLEINLESYKDEKLSLHNKKMSGPMSFSRSQRLRFYNHFQSWTSTCTDPGEHCPSYYIVSLLQDFIIRFNQMSHTIIKHDEFNNALLDQCTWILRKILQNEDKPLPEIIENVYPIKSSNLVSCKVVAIIRIITTLVSFIRIPPPFSLQSKHKHTGNKSSSNDFAVSSDGKDTLNPGIAVRNDTMIREIISMSIELLYYQDALTVSSTAILLHTILLHSMHDNTHKIFIERIQKTIESSLFTITETSTSSYVVHDKNNHPQYLLKDLAAILSKHNSDFCNRLLHLILNLLRNDCNKLQKAAEIILYRLLMSLFKIHPNAIQGQAPYLCSLRSSHDSCLKDLLVALSIYQAQSTLDHYFDGTIDNRMNQITSSMSPLALYQLANEAMSVSNFSLAHNIYKGLTESVSSTCTYLWLRSLAVLTEAEITTHNDGFSALPLAISKFDDAIEILRSLSSIHQRKFLDCHRNYVPHFTFQSSFLSLKRDLLSLLSLNRSFYEKSGLSDMHQEDLVTSTVALAKTTFTLYKRFGIFSCQPTREILRSILATCRFLYRTADYSGTQSSIKRGDDDLTVPLPQGNRSLNIELKAEYDQLLKGERALPRSLILNVMDNILLNPYPFPRYFSSTKDVPMAFLKVSSSPKETFARIKDDRETHETEHPKRLLVEEIEVQVDSSFYIHASGLFSNEYMSNASLYFSPVSLGSKITFHGTQKCLAFVDSGNSERNILVDPFDSASTKSTHEYVQVSLHPGSWYDGGSNKKIYGSKFSSDILLQPLKMEGYYTIHVRIQLCDFSLGGYEAVTNPKTNHILVHVNSSEA